jgi:hypothetical protein
MIDMSDGMSDGHASDGDVAEQAGVGSDRRSLLTKGAAVAAVAAVAGLSSSRTASAANGGTMLIGSTNSGTLDTKLVGGSTFWVADGTSEGSASLYGSQGTSAGSYGVRGVHSGSQGVGVFGEASGSSGRGVFGRTTGSQGTAVYGQHLGDTRTGTGVAGQSDNGAGLSGNGTTFDVVAAGSGRVNMVASTISTTASGAIGTIGRDASGNLWLCYATNKWQRLGGPAAAGAFHAIEPTRVFDSRLAAIPNSGVFAPNSSRVISIKDGRDLSTGAVTAANIVPAGATAIAYNVTATNTTAGSFLAITPGNAATFKASTLNWSAGGSSVANGTVVKIDTSRQVKIFAGPSGSFHVIIDVNGYYL